MLKYESKKFIVEHSDKNWLGTKIYYKDKSGLIDLSTANIPIAVLELILELITR